VGHGWGKHFRGHCVNNHYECKRSTEMDEIQPDGGNIRLHCLP